MIQRFYGTRFFEGPQVEITSVQQAYFDEIISQAGSAEHVMDIALDKPFTKYEFLWYAVERCGLLARGTNQAGHERFEPVEGQDCFERPVKAVFATSDAAWAMFFALVDRQNPLLRCFWGDALWAQPDKGAARKVYAYAINREAFENHPYTTGCLYLLPGANFYPVRSDQGKTTLEYICEQSIRPLARMIVTAADFPFLNVVQPFAFDDLKAMFEIQAAVVRKVEYPQSASLYYSLERTPLEKIQRATGFIRTFYPGFHVTVGEPQGDEVEVKMRFPVGAIQFCKEEWLGNTG